MRPVWPAAVGLRAIVLSKQRRQALEQHPNGA
jgi:hypothetical protein